MEVVTAVRHRLLQIDALRTYVARDTDGEFAVWKHRLLDSIDGTGRRAVVVRLSVPWTLPQPRNTQEYPTVALDLWADHDRDPSGGIAEANGEEKALAMFRVIDPLIHGIRGERWGPPERAMLVIGCSRTMGPILSTPHANQRQDGATGENAEEAAHVIVEYAIQTVH